MVIFYNYDSLPWIFPLKIVIFYSYVSFIVDFPIKHGDFL